MAVDVETIMIGDALETDILGGVQMGYRTILVLTGATLPADLAKCGVQPDMSLAQAAICFTVR